ncbi:Gfo/Idh/MocA family protein [Erwinia sp. S38]|uniref:Gfo/Idh/MocA family protein n=1 Tax=Erwinia sp. S38 TaxID=2769338 RepID=UPI0019093AAB|nr:Gfo/Idh/MocA family oxidoreductase [Erwinia sp. S38]MBK0002871.1 Gfo/Idh/MocA family oxidoreductase [Erwinia sp. S38]
MSLTIGWVGCGRHATQMLLPQLAPNNVTLGAVCDLNPQAAQDVARHYGVSAVYSDFQQLLAHPGLDAIGMAVGPQQHEEFAIAALKRGLPVFIEKPPGGSAEGAQAIAAASRSTGVAAYVGFMKRYSTGNKIAGNVLRSGDFGDVLGFQGNYMTAPGYFTGAVDYTSFYLHHCVHYMDLMPWLVGAEIVDLQARALEHRPGHLLAHLNMAFANGAIGTLVMGTVQSRGTPMENITVMGNHQRIEVDNVINVAWHRDPPFKAEDELARLDNASDTLCWTPNFTAAANEDHKGYHALLRDVFRGMKGESSQAPTIEDGVRAMQNLERMIAAINQQLRQR